MDMQDTVLITIFSSVVVGLLGWVATILKRRLAEATDRRTIYSWLQANTNDEPGESHVEAVAIAKGTRLSEDQVRRVCMSDSRIYRALDEPERWSVWRQKPQSIYEKRGLLVP